MTAASVTDPAELHEFANYLTQAEARLSELMTQTISRMEHVSTHWQDRVHQQFTEDFSTALDAIADLAELMNQHSRYVHFKAGQIEEYSQS